MRTILIILIFFSTIAWIILSLIFGQYNSSFDGYNEIGFPFTVYRAYSGKCFENIKLGFLLEGFLLDLIILIVINILVFYSYKIVLLWLQKKFKK
jgi:hypothetical protein